MKFLVKRTSVWDRRVSPCDGAVHISPEPDEWQSQWELEINSLDDLWEFVNTHGDIVLSRGSLADVQSGDTRLHLEIYDDYRE